VALRRLQITDFRCLARVELELDPVYTLLSGPNASGKTSLLEAVYLLGRGRSFRTRRLDPLIRSGSERFQIVGEVLQGERRVPLGVESAAGRLRARIGGERAAGLAALASVLPVQIIDPEVHRLIEEGPARRRRFLDWGVFHVEPTFIDDWQAYHLALKQRNAALRAGAPPETVRAWDPVLIRSGESVTAARLRYVESLSNVVAPLAERLLGAVPALQYRQGWLSGATLAEALLRGQATDREQRMTHAGPHRADLALQWEGAPVKDRISRGQQKLLAAALLLAQLELFPTEGAVSPTLLLDDPAAELDEARVRALLEAVPLEGVQRIVTTLDPRFAALGVPGQRYAVAGGTVVPADG